MSKHIITIAAAAALALTAGSALASAPKAGPHIRRAATPQQLAANALPPASNLAPSGEPAPAAAGVQPAYAINGFRSAVFGMTEDQVKAAISHDFGVAADKVRTETNPLQQTSALVVRTPLKPGPGDATVTYIFGATSHRLMHVNVVWITGQTPTVAERSAIVAAGAQLSGYFKAQPWPPKTADRTGLMNNGAILLFDATDTKGGDVQVALQNLPLTRTVNGKSETTNPKGPAILQVSYAQDAAHPDVFQIKQGSF